jgi:hypothetical protein
MAQLGDTSVYGNLLVTGDLLLHDIYMKNGKLSIGTSQADAPFHVTGGVAMTNGWNRTAIFQSNYPVLALNSGSKWAGIGYDCSSDSSGIAFWTDANSNDVPASGRQALRIQNNALVHCTNSLIVGIEGTSPTARKTIRINSGGYSEPAAFNTDSNGDKIILYDSLAGNYDARIGVGVSANMWFKSSQNTVDSGRFDFYTGNTPTMRMTITGSGCVGIGNYAPGYRLVVNKVSAAAPAIMVGGGYRGGPRIQTYDLVSDATAWMGLGNDMSGATFEHNIYFPEVTGSSISFGSYNGTTYTERMRLTRDGVLALGGLQVKSGIIDHTTADSYDKIRVYNGSSYSIGMKSAQSFGYLNDWAMTFTMNNETDRGFLWRDYDDVSSDGAMSLTTDGKLVVKQLVSVAKKYEIVYNSTENSLDFVYTG